MPDWTSILNSRADFERLGSWSVISWVNNGRILGYFRRNTTNLFTLRWRLRPLSVIFADSCLDSRDSEAVGAGIVDYAVKECRRVYVFDFCLRNNRYSTTINVYIVWCIQWSEVFLSSMVSPFDAVPIPSLLSSVSKKRWGIRRQMMWHHHPSRKSRRWDKKKSDEKWFRNRLSNKCKMIA